jgi:hypothetical protein
MRETAVQKRIQKKKAAELSETGMFARFNRLAILRIVMHAKRACKCLFFRHFLAEIMDSQRNKMNEKLFRSFLWAGNQLPLRHLVLLMQITIRS